MPLPAFTAPLTTTHSHPAGSIAGLATAQIQRIWQMPGFVEWFAAAYSRNPNPTAAQIQTMHTNFAAAPPRLTIITAKQWDAENPLNRYDLTSDVTGWHPANVSGLQDCVCLSNQHFSSTNPAVGTGIQQAMLVGEAVIVFLHELCHYHAWLTDERSPAVGSPGRISAAVPLASRTYDRSTDRQRGYAYRESGLRMEEYVWRGVLVLKYSRDWRGMKDYDRPTAVILTDPATGKARSQIGDVWTKLATGATAVTCLPRLGEDQAPQAWVRSG
ncbi:hypothetical protein DFJ77DRAFT_547397, partial [Powellomyces hirtus]